MIPDRKDEGGRRSARQAGDAQGPYPAPRYTAGPWFVLDQRATTLRSQGWEGPDHDAILISNYAPSDIRSDNCDCIVARIRFDNRSGELGDGNMADARLIASAPSLLEALQRIADESVFNQLRYAEEDDTDYFLRCFKAVKEAARAAIAKAFGNAS